jgi:hypothetical protein
LLHAARTQANTHGAPAAGGWSYYWNWQTDKTSWERPQDGLCVYPLKDGQTHGEW